MTIGAVRVGSNVPLPPDYSRCTRCGVTRKTNTSRRSPTYVCRECRQADPWYVAKINGRETS